MRVAAITLLPALQDPNPEDPLNKEAAQLFQDNQRQFQTYVQVWLG